MGSGARRLWRGLGAGLLSVPLLVIFQTVAQAQVECSNPNPDGSYAVPEDWELIPAGVSSGSRFRLMFFTSTRRRTDSTDIAVYNAYVQNRAKAGHAAISDSCASLFKVVGSTAAVNARVNTDTEASDTDAAIYWLKGVKIADDYADFYDESWDNTDSNGKPYKDEYGRTNRQSVFRAATIFTGTNNDGTTNGSNPLGSTLFVAAVELNVAQPLNTGGNTVNVPGHYYGLSPVFTAGHVITVTADGERVTEGESASFTLRAEPAPSRSIDVMLEVTDSGDFARQGRTGMKRVTLGKGQGSLQFTVATQNDGREEAHGSITATLRPGLYITGSESEAVVRVSDDDITATLSPGTTGIRALPEGGRMFWTVALSKTLDGDQTLTLPLSRGGTASWFPSFSQRITQDYRLGCETSPLMTCSNLNNVNPSITFYGAEFNKRPSVVNFRADDVLWIEAIVDNVAEADETVTLSLGGGRVRTITLKDPPSQVTLSFSRSWYGVREDTVVEIFQPTLRVNTEPGQDIVVPLIFTDITATGGEDYEAVATMTFPADGSLVESFDIPLLDDTVYEGDETFRVEIDASRLPDGVKVGSRSSATLEIQENDPRVVTPPPTQVPEVTVSAGASPVTEGTAASFTVSRTGSTASALTVLLSVAENTADGRDFVAAGNEGDKSVTIAIGSATATYSVATVGDTTDEPNGRVTVALRNSGDYNQGSPSSASVVVNDDDATPDTTAPRVTSIVRYVPNSSPTAANTLTWRVQFSEDVQNVDAADFTIAGTTANLSTSQAGNSSLYSVVASGGDLDNLDGTVTLSFANNQNIEDTSGNRLANTAPTGTNHNTFVVANTVSPPTPVTPVVTISAGTSPVTEGTAASFTVTATPAPPSPGLTVAVTASQTGEFAAPGNLSSLEAAGVDILAGETSYTFIIPTEDDSVDEPHGSLTVTVNPGSGYTVGSAATATVTVNDDDEEAADTTAPRVSSITRQTPSSSPTDADSLTWRVTFNEAVQNVDATDFQVSGTTAGLAVVRVGATNAYDVTASGGNLAGLNATVTLSFVSGQNIQDTSGNSLSNTNPIGGSGNDFFVVDNTNPDTTAPLVDSITRQTPSSSPTDADSLTWRVTFNEAVQNVDATDFQVSGTTAGLAVVRVGATNAYDVTASGGNLANLDDTVTLRFVGGQNIQDTSGNSLSNTNPTGANDNTFVVDNTNPDTTAPRVSSITRQTPSSSSTDADSLTWRVTFNEAVQNVDRGDFSITGTTATLAVAQVGATNAYDVTASGGNLPNLDDTVTLRFANGQNIQDTSGNRLSNTNPTGANHNDFVVDNSGDGDGSSPSPVPDDEDTLPVVQFSTTAYTGGEAQGSRTVNLLLSAQPPFSAATTVDYQVGGSATPGEDFTALAGTVSMSGSTATIPVSILDDQTVEDDETIVLTLTAANGYTVGSQGSATFTITDDDGATPPPSTLPVVSITAGGGVTEGEDATFTLTATPAPAQGNPVTVNLMLSARGEVISSGETGSRSVTINDTGTATVTVRTEDDAVQEEDSIVTARLQAGTGYAIHPSDSSASVTVRDNELARLSVPSLTVAAGESTSYTVTLAGQPMGAVTVTITPERVASLGRSASNTVENAMGLVVTPSRLLFTPSNWDDPQEVVVRVAEDAPAASLVLRHIASGDGLNGKGDTHLPVTVEAATETVDTDTETVDADTDAAEGVEAWRLRFGRTLSHQVADALQDRLSPPLPLQPGSRLTVAGEDFTSDTPLAENQGLLSKALGFENISPQLLVEGSSFSFSPQGEAGAPQLAFWGQGAFSSFSGQEDEVSLDGDVTTLLVGADWSTGRWQAGAALSRSWGNGSYDGDDNAEGEISTSLTGLFPYGRYALSPRLGLWATAGYGWGDLSLNPDGNGEEYKPDTTMTMVAVGMDGLLLDGGSEGVSLTTTADLLSLNTTSEEVEGRLESSEGKVSRLRLGLEATRPFPFANGSSLLPSLEVGIRQDGGDAETGFGLDLGAGITWKDPQRGISAELKGRTLLSHAEEDFQDQGLALSFSWDPSPSNRGPSLSVSHAMGATATADMDALFNPATFEQTGNPSNGQQFAAELAYGFPVHNDRLTLTPAVAMALSPTSRNYGLLWSLAPYTEQRETDPWQFSIEAERQEHSSPSTPTDHSLKLNFSTLF